jgi:mannose-1-phosphate guanylyltransferase
VKGLPFRSVFTGDNELHISIIGGYVCSEDERLTVASGKDRWAVILAGGDGTRLQSLTRMISGDDRPKQFCAFQGSATLLEQTRQRVALSVPNKYTLTVVTQIHERFYKPLFKNSPKGQLLVQPINKGTAPAILFSALKVAQLSPNATVAFFPSDHHLTNEPQFMEHVESAFAAVRPVKKTIKTSPVAVPQRPMRDANAASRMV